MAEKKIILPYFFGLGDHGQFSTLPRRLNEAGYDVYISDKAKYRNREIYDLWWGMNPFVIGESSEPANVGDSVFEYKNHGLGLIGNWEKQAGLGEPYSKFPEIYYQPKLHDNLKDITLIDFSCVSLHEEYARDADKLKKLVPKENYLFLLFSQDVCSPNDPYFQLQSDNGYVCKDIFDYCDVLHSCKKLLCLMSGAAVIESALQRFRQFDVECFLCDNYKTRNSEIQDHYMFPNIKYTWI